MTCEQRRDLIPLYVADALDAAEREDLRHHLAAGCVACAGQLAEARATFAAVGLAADPVVPPPGLLERVLDRIDREAERSTAHVPRASFPAWRWLLPSAAAAAVAATVTYAAVVRRDRATLAEGRLNYNTEARAMLLRSALADRDQTVEQLRRKLAGQQQVVDALQLGGAGVVPLAGVGQASAAAELVWAPAAGRAYLSATHLALLPAGRTYELWYITTDERKVPAATFAVNADGAAIVAAPIPLGLAGLAVAAVTDEPVGGRPSPTGTIQLAGKAP